MLLSLRQLSRLALFGLVAAGCTDAASPERSVLTVSLPRSVRQALASSDAALCAQLEVRLTFDDTADLAPPPIDDRALAPKPGAVCTWVLDETVNLKASVYDLVVRFQTRDAPGTCAGPLLVGAYVKRGLTFPFPPNFAGLTDDDFYSFAGEEEELRIPGLSFDPDEDGRDNLSEVGQGSDPCKLSSLPVVSLETGTSSAAEGETVRFVLRSSDEDGVAHRVRFSVRHGHGPNVGTELIELRAFTDDRGAPVRSPLNIPALEKWRLQVSADADPSPGAATWTIDLALDEPFVGPLTVAYSADDGQSTVLFAERRTTLTVENVDDPTVLLFEEDGAEVERSVLRFPEVGNAPVEHSFRFEDEDLDADVSTWTAVLASNDSGATLRRDGARWTLGWEPTNEQVVRPPVGGHRVTLGFMDGARVTGQAELALEVSPLFNDPITLAPPQVGELALPSVTFTEHRVHFQVADPDEVESAPGCVVNLAAASGTSCDPAAAFTSVRCETNGVRQGATWPMVLVLSAAADFRAQCGAGPAFTLSYTVTDVPPLTASNGPSSAASGPLGLRTANVVQGAVVSPGTVGPPNFRFAEPAIVVGSRMKALVEVQDPDNNYERGVYAVDLTFPSPSFSFSFPRATLCELDDFRPDQSSAVDESSGRVLVYGRVQSGTYCTGEAGAYLVDVNTNAVQHYSRTALCGSASANLGNPVVARDGSFYVPCHDSTASVGRLDPAGAVTRVAFTGLSMSNPITPYKSGLVYSPANVPWLIWPGPSGLVALNLATLGDATPTRQAFPMDADWWRGDIDGFVVDEARSSYVFVYNRYNADAELWRVSLASETPVLEGPIALGDIGGSGGNSYARPILRDPSSVEPSSGADLIVSAASSGDPRPMVDLDGFTLALTRPNTDFFLGSSAGLLASPDRRFYVAPVQSSDDGRGIYLYPWDHEQPRQFVSLPVPNGGVDSARFNQVSTTGKLILTSADDELGVIYFVDALQGLD